MARRVRNAEMGKKGLLTGPAEFPGDPFWGDKKMGNGVDRDWGARKIVPVLGPVPGSMRCPIQGWCRRQKVGIETG